MCGVPYLDGVRGFIYSDIEPPRAPLLFYAGNHHFHLGAGDFTRTTDSQSHRPLHGIFFYYFL